MKACDNCDSWCGESTDEANCYKRTLEYKVNQVLEAVKCKKGYFFKDNSCQKCINNCDECEDAEKCLTCSQEYTLGLGRICVACS